MGTLRGQHMSRPGDGGGTRNQETRLERRAGAHRGGPCELQRLDFILGLWGILNRFLRGTEGGMTP